VCVCVCLGVCACLSVCVARGCVLTLAHLLRNMYSKQHRFKRTACMCVHGSERERERESEWVCACVSLSAYVFVRV